MLYLHPPFALLCTVPSGAFTQACLLMALTSTCCRCMTTSSSSSPSATRQQGQGKCSSSSSSRPSAAATGLLDIGGQRGAQKYENYQSLLIRKPSLINAIWLQLLTGHFLSMIIEDVPSIRWIWHADAYQPRHCSWRALLDSPALFWTCGCVSTFAMKMVSFIASTKKYYKQIKKDPNMCHFFCVQNFRKLSCEPIMDTAIAEFLPSPQMLKNQCDTKRA